MDWLVRGSLVGILGFILIIPISNNAAGLDYQTFCGLPLSEYHIIQGTEDDDYLEGTEQNDLIIGFGGNDTIYDPGGWHNCIFGGDGDDVIQAYGLSKIFAGSGNDEIYSSGGDDTVFAGEGNDIIWGTGGNDIICTGPGDDEFTLRSGTDIIDGEIYENSVYLGTAPNNPCNEEGFDNPILEPITVNTTTEMSWWVTEHSIFCGRPLSEYNLIQGTEGNDNLVGTTGDDLIIGFEGDDMIFGLSGQDCIYSGDDEDIIDPGPGQDMVFAGWGRDLMYGNSGGDTFCTGPGDDEVRMEYETNRIDGYLFESYNGIGKDPDNSCEEGLVDIPRMEPDSALIDSPVTESPTTEGEKFDYSIYCKNPHNNYKVSEYDLIIEGTDGKDRLEGTIQNEVIIGYGGNDIIEEPAGWDTCIFGGDGDDKITTGQNAIVYGGSGNDIISTGAGNDIIFGGPGNDYIYPGVGLNQTVYGGEGNDYIHAVGNIVVCTGPGEDEVILSSGKAIVDGEMYIGPFYVGPAPVNPCEEEPFDNPVLTKITIEEPVVVPEEPVIVPEEPVIVPEEPVDIPEPDDTEILETQGKCNDVNGVPDTTSADELIQFGISSFDPSDVKNLGCEVSKIAQLHKFLSSEDKVEQGKFKKLFHEFMGDVKIILGKGQGMKVLALEQVLKKGEQKLNTKFSQIEANKIKEHKLKTAPDLVNKRKDLVKTKNLIGVLDHFLNDGPDKDKILEELGKKKIGLQKAVLIADAEHNGKKITTEFLTKVDEKIANENKPTPSSDHNEKDNKGKSQKSNNGKSDKGNNSKSNKGKGKSK